MKEVQFELRSPFDYSHQGDVQSAQFITLTAPSFKQMDKVAPIKQAFTAAIVDMSKTVVDDQDQAEEKGDGEITGAQIMQLMYNGSGDMTKVFLHAEQLFKSGVALVDGEVKLTTPLMEKMSFDDFEALTGCYIANFIAPSLMDGQQTGTD